jgi:hypothetical protein
MRHQLPGLWQHGSALMSWLGVITGFVGVAMCTIAILLL